MLVRNCPVSHSNFLIWVILAILRNIHIQTTLCESLSRPDLLHEKNPQIFVLPPGSERFREHHLQQGFPLPQLSQSRSSLLGSGMWFSSRYEKVHVSWQSSSLLARLLSSSYRSRAVVHLKAPGPIVPPFHSLLNFISRYFSPFGFHPKNPSVSSPAALLLIDVHLSIRPYEQTQRYLLRRSSV